MISWEYLVRVFKYVHVIARKNDSNTLYELYRLILYKIKTGHGIDMYQLYSLDKKNISDWVSFIGKREMSQALHKVNNQASFYLLDDKVEFYIKCKQNCLSAVNVLYTIHANRNYDGLKNISSYRDLECTLMSSDSEEFVIKPVKGSYGDDIYSIKRNKNIFIDLKSGKYISLYDVYKAIVDFNKPFMVQNLVCPHHKLQSIMPYPACGIFRLVSYYSFNNECKLLYMFVTIPVKGQIISNFKHGQTGNLLLGVDMDTGSMTYAYGFNMNNVIAKFKNHPDSHVPFESVEIPYWDEMHSLVLNASFLFKETRFVGWDIAITNDGPILLEGNPMCDPDGIQMTLQKGIKQDLYALIDT